MFSRVVVALLLAATAQTPLTVRVVPAVLFADQSVIVMCHITPNDQNRELRAGIAAYTESSRSLEGSLAPAAFQFTFPHIPCGADHAYCALLRTDGSRITALANLLVNCQ